MTTVYVAARRHRLSPSMVIGSGGEAEVYDLGNGQALKLYRSPDDPLYARSPDSQAAARQRLAEHQRKLAAFPSQLPPEVVAPLELAYNSDSGGQVVGYTMPFLKNQDVLLMYGDRDFREQGGIDANITVSVLRTLHQLVTRVHRAGVVIGDFNDLNILVDQAGALHLVDADSMQFGPFHCRAFTPRFVDPLVCAPDQLLLKRPHNEASDWYAFTTMVLQSLLFVGPYGGVHRPKAGKRLQHDARVLQRLTFLSPDVVYPKPALPYTMLPDEFLELFHRVYEGDERSNFPLTLLETMRWTTCTACNLVHARTKCPGCAAPGMVKQVLVIRGTVTATRVLQTHGTILHAVYQNGQLRYLVHEQGSFRREDSSEVAKGTLDPQLRYRIGGRQTFIGKQGRVTVLAPNAAPEQFTTNTMGALPVYDVNETGRFWIQSDQLVRDGRLGSQFIGTVLAGRTLFWVGHRFGFGFYRAGELTRAFVFSVNGRGFNDAVALPKLVGHLIDATCVFSDKLAWFLTTTQEGGRLVNRCSVIDATGTVIAQAEAAQDEDSWLAHGIRGRFASGQSLYAATDDGIVRITAEQGTLGISQRFPDTEPFVDATTRLLPGSSGIYAVSTQEITLLQMK